VRRRALGSARGADAFSRRAFAPNWNTFVIWINRVIGVALIGAAIPFWIMASAFPGAAKIFPHLILVTIACLSVIMVARSFIPAVRPVHEGEGINTLSGLWRPLATFAVVVFAIAAMAVGGFFPAMMAMAALLFPILRVKNVKLYVVACGLVLAFVYVVFVLVLKVPLTLLQAGGS
jgi:Tripartite tricarboxylate transporter TctB family